MRYRSLVVAAALLAVPALAFLPGALVWNKLGETHLDRGSCRNTSSCKWSKAIDKRYHSFAFSSDGAQGINLVGRTWIECKDGVRYEYYLSSAAGPGIFQGLGNSCENYDVATLNVEITDADIPSVDEARGVNLMVYAAEL